MVLIKTPSLILFSMLLLALFCASGCATPALLRMGKRLEKTSHIIEARLTKDAVIIVYSVNVDNKETSTSADRWLTVPLSRLDKIIKRHKDPKAASFVTEYKGDVERFLDDYGVDLERMKVQSGPLPEFLRRSSSPLPLISVSSVDNVERHLPVREMAVAVQANCPRLVWIMMPIKGERGDFIHCDMEYRYTRPRSTYFLIVPLMPFAVCYDALVVFPFFLITQPSFK